MRLSVLKVSIPVLMLAVFQTGDCGFSGRFVRKTKEMSNMTPMQKIEARRNFWAEVEGQPAERPAPAPQSAVQQPIQQPTPQVEGGSVAQSAAQPAPAPQPAVQQPVQQPTPQVEGGPVAQPAPAPQPIVQQPILSYVEDLSANEYDSSDDESSKSSSWLGNIFNIISRNVSRRNSPVQSEVNSPIQSDDEAESEFEIDIRQGVNGVQRPVSMSIGERTFDVAEESFVTNSEESFCEDATKPFTKVEKGGEYSVNGRKYSNQCAICSLSLTPEEEEKVPVEIREKLSNAGGVQADDSALWKRIAESVQKRIFVYECQENRVTAFYEYGDSYEDLKRVCLEDAHYQQLVEEK